MDTFQFNFQGDITDLVIDVDADSREEAVAKLRAHLDAHFDNGGDDDPSTLNLTADGIYARVWLNLANEDVTDEKIVDRWPADAPAPTK